MSRPGDRLRALAARVFDAQTMERLVDPVIADLRAENDDAIRAGRTWRSRWLPHRCFSRMIHPAVSGRPEGLHYT